MTTPPTWTYDAEDNAYTLIRDTARCRVWFTALGTWAAIVTQHGMSTAAYKFSAHEDAQAWCELQVTK